MSRLLEKDVGVPIENQGKPRYGLRCYWRASVAQFDKTKSIVEKVW